MRPGRVWRSPALSGLAPADLAALEALDPGLIVDLRGREEVTSAPPGLPDALAARRVHLPVEPKLSAPLRRMMLDGTLTAAAMREALIGGYRSYVEEHSGDFAEFLRLVAGSSGPVVFHCTAGKDRTGFAAALLLGALGAAEADVLADYLLTNDLWTPPTHLAELVPEAAHAALFRVEAAYLQAALSALRAAHAGEAAFAAASLGGEDRLASLAEALTEPA